MNIFKQKRKSLKQTQKQFAMTIGIPVYAVSRMENGYLALSWACAFCNAYPEFEIRQMQVMHRDNYKP